MLAVLSLAAVVSASITTVPAGGHVYIGESGLNITASVPSDGTQIGWWPTADISSFPSVTNFVFTPGSYSISPTDYSTNTGNWYVLPDKTLAFVVVDPSLDIRVRDVLNGTDVTGNLVDKGTELKFRITSNLFPITERGVPGAPVSVHVKKSDGATLSVLLNKSGSSNSLGDIPVSTMPYDTLPFWDTGASTYEPGTYTVWADCNVNGMRDNYRLNGSYYTTKTITPSYTVTLTGGSSPGPNTINGTIYYTGTQNATVYLHLFNQTPGLGIPAWKTKTMAYLGSPLSYGFSTVNGTFWLMSYMDLNGNHTPDFNEPWGFAVNKTNMQGPDPISVTGNMTGLDITLYEPSSGPHTINGTIYYTGTQNATVYLHLFNQTPGPGVPAWKTKTLAYAGSPISYGFSAFNGTFWLMSYMDLNGNHTPDFNEPWGFAVNKTNMQGPDPITVTGNMTGLDITLYEPQTPNANLILGNMHTVASSEDSLTHGIQPVRIDRGLNIGNNNPENLVLENVSLTVDGSHITNAGPMDVTTWNSTHIRWDYTSPVTIPPFNAMDAGWWNTNLTDTADIPISINRWVNQSIFTSPGDQLFTFNATFENTTCDWIYGRISSGYGLDNASILVDSFRTDAPIENLHPVNNREFGFNLNMSTVQAHRAYNFSITIFVDPTNAEGRAVEYKPWCSIQEGFGTGYRSGVLDSKTATMPSDMLPSAVTNLTVASDIPLNWNYHTNYAKSMQLNAIWRYPSGGPNTINGTIYYAGTQNATVYIHLFNQTPGPGVPALKTKTMTYLGSPLSYGFSTFNGTFWVMSYMDLNGNHTPDFNEPWGLAINKTFMQGPDPIQVTGNMTGLDITLYENNLTANFTANPTAGTAPLTVIFTDSSTNMPTSWNWSFGDGSIVNSTMQNPVHTFAAPGTYTVSLNVSNSLGFCSLGKTDYITVSSGSETYVFVTKWGTEGSDDGQFFGPNSPYGVATDSSGNVYVSDTDNYRIQKFSSTGAFITKWGTRGSDDGQFENPYGVAVDSSGNVYVADYYNNRIQKFSSTGDFITKWGTIGSNDGQFNLPGGVTVDSSGNVYVADVYNHRIQKFSSTGDFITKWGTPGSNDGQFNYPRDVAADPSGNVYVSDTGNDRIQKFSSTGAFITKWGTRGSEDGQFINVRGLATDSSGNVYISDGENYRIQKFSSTGLFLTKGGSFGFADGQFAGTTGIAVDSSGNVYVADSGSYRIQKFALSSTKPPVANFTATPNSGTAPLTVQFIDSSTNTPTSWNWSFGDGNFAPAQNPVHNYPVPGIFSVSLDVSNPGGSNTTIRTGYVTVYPKGDLNANWRVDIGDVTRVAYMVVGLVTPDPRADFHNGNGTVLAGDAAKIAWYYVGKIPEL